MTPATSTSAQPSLRELLRPLTRGRRRRLAVLAVLALCGGFAEATVLVLIARIGFAITATGSRADVELGPLGALDLSIGTMIVAAGVLTAIRFALQAAAAWYSSRLTSEALVDVRKTLMRRFLAASWSVQARERQGELQDLLTTYASQSANVLSTLLQGTATLCNLAALMATALVVNGLGALAVLAGMALLIIALRPFRQTIRRIAGRAARANTDFATSLTEVASTAQEIRVFNVEQPVQRELDTAAETHGRAYATAQFLGGILPGVYQTAALLLVVAFLGVVYEVDRGSLASMGAIVLMMVRSLSYGQLLQSVYQNLHGSAPYLERLQDQEREYAEAAVPRDGKAITEINDLAFDDVSFEYEAGVPVLRGVSFRVPRGEIVGIVGPSGSGKTTLVQLLLRLRQPTKGAVLANGIDVDKLSLDDWYEHVAFVPQEPHLVRGSIAENIRFFRDEITDDQIRDATKRAHLHEEVDAWPGGYDTPVGERGSQISGGQKQRLCIARALVGEPDVVVLDEPTSALDVRSEALVRDTLKGLGSDATVFVVAHRLSTVAICDRIMVLLGGRIEGFDAPAILEAENPFYREALELSGLR